MYLYAPVRAAGFFPDADAVFSLLLHLLYFTSGKSKGFFPFIFPFPKRPGKVSGEENEGKKFRFSLSKSCSCFSYLHIHCKDQFLQGSCGPQPCHKGGFS